MCRERNGKHHVLRSSIFLLAVFSSLSTAVFARSPLDLPIVVSEKTGSTAVLPEAVLPGESPVSSAGLFWTMAAGAEADDIPQGTLLCRLPEGLDWAEVRGLVDSIRSARPDTIPVVPVRNPFEAMEAPSGILLEVPSSASGGWLLYRHYLMSTFGVRFLVPELNEAEILLGAAAGRLPAGSPDREAEMRLARLYSLIWTGGGYRTRRVNERALLLLPGEITPDALACLEGVHRAVIEAGFFPRILSSASIGSLDATRYRAVVVPFPGGMDGDLPEVLEEVAFRGGVVVLGGDPGRFSSLAGVRKTNTDTPVSLRFTQTDPPLPQIGADGLSRAVRSLEAEDAAVFLGGPRAPMICLRKVGAGNVFLLNIDFTHYARLSAAGVAGAAQVREILRFALGRAGVERLAGTNEKEAPSFLGLRGPVPAGMVEEEWFRLVFLWTEGEGPSALFAPGAIRRTIVRGKSFAVEGTFKRRPEWLTARVVPRGESHILRLEAGGVDLSAGLPVLLSLPRASGACRLRPVFFRKPVVIDSLRRGDRVLVEDLLYSYRALAVCP